MAHGEGSMAGRGGRQRTEGGAGRTEDGMEVGGGLSKSGEEVQNGTDV